MGHLTLIRCARRFDPRLETNLAFDLAMAYYLKGRYREALSVSESHLGSYPRQSQTGRRMQPNVVCGP